MAEEQVEEVKEAGGGKKKTVLIIVIVLVVVLAAAGGAAFFLLGKKGAEPKDPKQTEESKKEAEATVMKAIEEPFLVNLADTDTARYLKVKVSLELENEAMAEEVEKKLPQINDEIIMLLSSKTFEEVTTVAGKQALKQAMLNNINSRLKEGKLVNVYFTEFVVQ